MFLVSAADIPSAMHLLVSYKMEPHHRLREISNPSGAHHCICLYGRIGELPEVCCKYLTMQLMLGRKTSKIVSGYPKILQLVSS